MTFDGYIKAMRGVIDITGNMSAAEYESAVQQIEEELFADAYAGINAFGAGADQFTEAVNEKMDTLYLGKQKMQDNGTAEPTGPPTERFSADEDVPGLSLPTLEDVDGEPSGQKENTARGGERYSISESFEEELQEWFDATTHNERKVSGKRFLVGTTTDVLKSIGVKEYNIYFGGSKIDKILTDNTSINLDTIKQAVTLLEDPILIMKSATVEDSIVLFGEVFTSGNKPVMISLLLNPKTKSGEVLDYAVITSAYGRRTSNLQNLIDKSTIYYVNKNKNRTENWLKALGLQLPSAITKFGPIASINDPGSPVKGRISNETESQQFKRWFGDWQNHPENSGKVVNADGTPKVVYHGSAEQFTTFSYGHIGSSTGAGILGDGFYFTDKKSLAKNYGKTVYSAYLQIRNPYIATESDAYRLRTEDIQQQGYDGVILRAPQGDVYMVFENTQIKSATDNIGTFDGNNPDIRYSVDDGSEDDIQGLSLPSLEEDTVQSGYIKEDISAETVEADIIKVANMEPVTHITERNLPRVKRT